MNHFFAQASLEKAAKFLWATVLLTIPFTTFPFIPGPLGRSTIKPLALYPLLLLIPVLLFIQLKRRRLSLPPNTLPLLAFLLFALTASVIALAYSPLELRGADFLSRTIKAWLSVGLGLAFFLSAFWMNRTRTDLKFTLKWLYIALGLTLLWSLIQAVAVNTDLIRRSSINEIQFYFSDRGVQPRRVSGFAAEPAWLADQLVIYFIPWLFAAILSRYSFLKQKWIEWILLALSLAVLLFSFSRGGILGSIVAFGLVFLFLGRESISKFLTWIWRPFSALGQTKRLQAILIRAALIAVLVIVVYSAFIFASDYPYFANLWQASTEQSLSNYLIEINIAQRVAYAAGAYEVYQLYPYSGVGLGASGLYLIELLPDWALGVPEVARLLDPGSLVVPNAKNMYTRLLAETGLPGFIFFMAFALSFLPLIRRQLFAGPSWLRYAATAALFSWTGIMVRNLTQDSLTWPIMWVSFGLIAGLVPNKNQKE